MEIIEPNVEMLAITRLYLEKYEALAEADRELFRDILRGFAAPRIEMIPPTFDEADMGERLREMASKHTEAMKSNFSEV